ncbi:hypothetical protein PR202_gb02205 [Eleusine coracana subsp. coracana]|uniref:DUF6598 domain-containing protein n=1 Tax=Eleusine coracana subsp. coracana TaxID=191504 RepID=A0AAV5DYK3_ELECO|nr:hypothetical protein PR202_gb02205 [Eleusine coracana subsp. coracana]
MFFEINLKIKDDTGDITTFSKGVIEHDTCISNGQKVMEHILTSWHSKVQLAYTPVPYAVTATLSVSMLEGAREFTGEVIAWTSKNETKIILHDSKVAGTSTELGADGSVALSRCLVAVPVDEKLVLRICVRDSAAEAECLEFTLGHLHDHRTCFLDSYKLRVDVEWTGILFTMREDVYERVGQTRLLL